eukprot:GHVS01074350.1.p1 GENE.GHVS01074350.1~~GHVS01074350.1.p1  ORF type:complete len:421 (-),score=80.01 GHVS01074350.1:340-1518(-)
MVHSRKLLDTITIAFSYILKHLNRHEKGLHQIISFFRLHNTFYQHTNNSINSKDNISNTNSTVDNNEIPSINPLAAGLTGLHEEVRSHERRLNNLQQNIEEIASAPVFGLANFLHSKRTNKQDVVVPAAQRHQHSQTEYAAHPPHAAPTNPPITESGGDGQTNDWDEQAELGGLVQTQMHAAERLPQFSSLTEVDYGFRDLSVNLQQLVKEVCVVRERVEATQQRVTTMEQSASTMMMQMQFHDTDFVNQLSKMRDWLTEMAAIKSSLAQQSETEFGTIERRHQRLEHNMTALQGSFSQVQKNIHDLRREHFALKATTAHHFDCLRQDTEASAVEGGKQRRRSSMTDFYNIGASAFYSPGIPVGQQHRSNRSSVAVMEAQNESRGEPPGVPE